MHKVLSAACSNVHNAGEQRFTEYLAVHSMLHAVADVAAQSARQRHYDHQRAVDEQERRNNKHIGTMNTTREITKRSATRRLQGQAP